MNIKDPDELLAGTNRSTILNAAAISLAIHLVIIFGTSFGLYSQWGEYGFHSPSTIKQLKKARETEAEEESRRKAAEERAAAQEAAKTQQGAQPAAPGSQPAAAPGQGNAQQPVAPELDPLPPKSGFTLGEDFTL